MQISGVLLILIASLMSASIAVLNRSLKDVPYSVVLFYHSFFGVFMTFVFLASAVLLISRPLYFLDFTPFDNLLLFSATGFDALGVMC